MNDGRKNVPFTLPDDDDEDVFSSVEVQRSDETEPLSSSSTGGMFTGRNQAVSAPDRNSQPLQAVTRKSAPLKAPAAAAPRAPMPRLVVETSGQPGANTVDVTSPVFTIGRQDADLDIADEYVSPFHAQIRIDSDGAFLQDLGSRNGVFLRIADDLALEDWDEIAVGTQRFVFRTTWDPPSHHSNPNKPRNPAIGGNLPSDAARLIQMYSGGQLGGVWRVFDRVTIGRQNADVCEPDDPWLSAPHATIERRDNNQFFIKDARSQHGTFIRVLDSVELIDGDVFMVGRSRIKITYP